MNKKFEKQTTKYNDRAYKELCDIKEKKGFEYVKNKIFNKDVKLAETVISGKKKIPEKYYIKICEEGNCDYDYIIGTTQYRNKEEREKDELELDRLKKQKEKEDITIKKLEKKLKKSRKGKKPKHEYDGTRAQSILMEINQTKGKEGIEFIQNELGLTSDKSVINLLKGTYPISEKHYPKIAAMGNCSIAYLKGESNARNKKELNENIKKLEEEVSKLYNEKTKLYEENSKYKYVKLLTDNARDGLNRLSLFLDSSLDEIQTDIKFESEYADIVSYMIRNVNLWTTLIEAAERLIATKTDIDELIKFENYHNRNIDIDYECATSITPEEEAELRIKKAIVGIFFEYIAMKEKELNLDEINLEVEEDKMIKQMLKDKNRNK